MIHQPFPEPMSPSSPAPGLHGIFNGKNVEWMEKVTDEQYDGK
jgi:hypothetical protein